MDGYLGEIRMFAGDYAPENWAICNGDTLQISQHEALYTILGTKFGGNGSTTFKIPDFTGRVPMGGVYSQVSGGEMSGEPLTGDGYVIGIGGTTGSSEVSIDLPAHTHTIPGHGHSMNVSLSSATTEYPISGSILAVPDEAIYAEHANVEELHSVVVNASGGNTGSSGTESPTVSNVQPSLVINFIICIVGSYPST